MIRRVVLLLAAMAVAVLLVGAAAVDQSGRAAAAKNGTKVITRTFSSNQQITIPTSGAAAPYPSEKNISSFKTGKVLDVDLTLKNYSHTFPDDVDVLLSKGGLSRTVMSDVGEGTDVNNITLKLDDEAANSLPDNDPLVGGRFKPTNFGAGDSFPAPTPTPNPQSALSGFDGENPNGGWKLRVVDDANLDGGAFAGGWSLTIKARVQK